jgi:hypothetical protein
MVDKDQIRKDEENVKHTPEEPEVTELDDQSLEEASGGYEDNEEIGPGLANSNTNCLC